jgi:dihydroorotase
VKIHIKNGRLIDPKNGIDAVRDVFIAAGKVVGIGDAPEAFGANQTIDASGLVVCPGLVDLPSCSTLPMFIRWARSRASCKART